MVKGQFNPNITCLGEKLTPLDHSDPEMKFTYFHHNCWKNKHNAELQRADPGTKVTE